MGNVRNIPHENTIIIYKYSICRLRILDPVYDPLTNLSGTVLCTALNLNFRCTDIGIKTRIIRFTHLSTFLYMIEVFKEHGHRQYLRQRISYVQSLSLRP